MRAASTGSAMMRSAAEPIRPSPGRLAAKIYLPGTAPVSRQSRHPIDQSGSEGCVAARLVYRLTPWPSGNPTRRPRLVVQIGAAETLLQLGLLEEHGEGVQRKPQHSCVQENPSATEEDRFDEKDEEGAEVHRVPHESVQALRHEVLRWVDGDRRSATLGHEGCGHPDDHPRSNHSQADRADL